MNSTFDNQIVPLNKITERSINRLTVREIISLLFHVAERINNEESQYSTLTTIDSWKELYVQFGKDLREQLHRKWPKLEISKNDFDRRIDILTVSHPFVRTKNLFTLLHRLLYIENYKRLYVYKSYGYHKILSHRLGGSDKRSVSQINLEEILLKLRDAILYYLSIYNEEQNIESQIANSILEYL